MDNAKKEINSYKSIYNIKGIEDLEKQIIEKENKLKQITNEVSKLNSKKKKEENLLMEANYRNRQINSGIDEVEKKRNELISRKENLEFEKSKKTRKRNQI